MNYIIPVFTDEKHLYEFSSPEAIEKLLDYKEIKEQNNSLERIAAFQYKIVHQGTSKLHFAIDDNEQTKIYLADKDEYIQQLQQELGIEGVKIKNPRSAKYHLSE